MTKELLKECYDELANLNGLVVKSEKVDCDFDDLLDRLSKEIIKPNKTIGDYYQEWEAAITELSDKEIQLSEVKEEYNKKEFDIVFLNKENIDFKELYGSTSEKVRKQHAAMELKNLADEKTDLELSIDYLKRHIDFIKSIVQAKLYGV